jgi:hypothetical protein
LVRRTILADWLVAFNLLRQPVAVDDRGGLGARRIVVSTGARGPLRKPAGRRFGRRIFGRAVRV